MSVPPQALQFAGSLVAILMLAWLVRQMGLGSAPRLESDSAAIAAAARASDGFAATSVARDRDGMGALLRDADGQIMLLKPHGVHFAGRILGPSAEAHRDGNALAVNPGEKRFGTVILTIADAASWEEAIHHLSETGNA